MVKSNSSCFKIITCSGGDAVNDDGFERIESKSSSMKRGWSFRKKSDRHRNTVILEDSSGGNREHLEAVTTDSHGYTSQPIFEKISPSKTVDMTAMASDANSKVPDPILLTEKSRKIDPIISTESDDIGSLGIIKDASKVDPEMEESFAIVIQAAIRGYLSQKALLKIKNVVKLQAAVRGHLVRSQAVGTLRCVQAISKMQALVRARRAQMLLEGSAVNKDADGFGRNEKNTTPVGKELKANPSFYCSEKILRNAFARQLLDSTPKKKPIHIKCDPLRPDSAWIWLERWMSASSPDQPQQPEFHQSNEENERLVDATSCGVQTIAPSESVSETGGSKADLKQTTDSDGEDSSIEDADSFDIQFLKPATSKDDKSQQLPFDGVGEAEVNSKTQTNQTELSANLASESVINSIPSEPGAESEQPKHVSKRIPSEQPETEGKKIVIGSRKASNPAFVAAQSKFEELSSAISPSMSFGSTNKGIAIESRFDGPLSPANSQTQTTEMTMSEGSVSHDSRMHAGGLDLGTEVSRSSTLDSPGRSEVTSGEKKGESKVVEEVVSDLNGTTSLEHPDDENPGRVHPEKLDAVDSVVDRDIRQPERSASDVQHELSMDQPGYRSSPEGSLRSHVTAPESYGTPSSQVSVKAKRKDSSTRTQSRKSKSADKRSPSNPNHDSGTRNSTEKLLKSGKRRNSFGSTKTDNADDEPRESNSSTLPSYMQATESARAKAQANNSPRSSPDVQDSELYLKKRHSLPNASGKQGSPRVLSSSPQAQLIAKGDQAPPSRGRWQR